MNAPTSRAHYSSSRPLDERRTLAVILPVDVFHWGWITDKSDCQGLFAAAEQVKCESSLVERARTLLGLKECARQVGEDLRARGLARFIGASFHSRRQAAQWLHGPLDVMMLRYNLAHRGAESEVFPLLLGDETIDPGIVAFNVAHEGFHFFDRQAPGGTTDFPRATAPDCYRFALSNPAIDLVLTGVRNKNELDQALEALEHGPLDPDELHFMRQRRTPQLGSSSDPAIGVSTTKGASDPGQSG